jgi:hypothetical protein
VTISDTSLTPISYSITANTPSQDEGLPIIFTITTTGVVDGTIVYWINTGTTRAADFPNSANDGSVAIQGSSATITRSATADFTTEGSETIIIELHSESVNGPLLATSSTVTVVDVSTTPILPTYDVAPSVYSVNEGSSLIFYVTTVNVPNGTVLYWAINTNVGDFSVNTGSFTINSNAAQFSVTPTADSTTEGPESFSLSIKTTVSGQPVATSPTVTIGDASTTPPPPETDPTPVVAMGAVSPSGGYGVGQPYSVTYTTSYASSVSGSVTGVSSTSLSTTGTYSWTNAGTGVRTVTITASGSGGTSTLNASYAVYQPQIIKSPLYPTVRQTFYITIASGIPFGAMSWSGPDGNSGSTVLDGVGNLVYAFLGPPTVGSTYYDVYLTGTGSVLYDATDRVYIVVHPDELITSSTGANGSAGVGINVSIAGGAPNVTVSYSITANSGGPSPYPPGTATSDAIGNTAFAGLVFPVGNYTLNFTFPAFNGGVNGTTIAQRTRSITINFT